MTDADCPLNPAGHKYFTYAIKTDYEPMEYTIDSNSVAVAEFIDHLPELFRKVEYAILSCNCSSVLRVRVRKQ